MKINPTSLIKAWKATHIRPLVLASKLCTVVFYEIALDASSLFSVIAQLTPQKRQGLSLRFDNSKFFYSAAPVGQSTRVRSRDSNWSLFIHVEID